ncbi:hypothetical protein HHK36_014855 [Tetracentron sinense]|uniref:DUF7054 domain-containing protein n=1 Tax=Tetracentron sinense TaxID=13715 RepID=A0A834Z201_TETSI|nr:hypothetical protein HHK36_014855 [Tetracentron sinense]
MLPQKSKKIQKNGKRVSLLITVNVLGSSGPIRFLVNEEELVASVINTALKSYARQGRLPVLGSDLNNFHLYCSNAGFDALSPWETIGSRGGRNFVLCKKQSQTEMMDGDGKSTTIARKGSGSWKAWINKSLNFKISSH